MTSTCFTWMSKAPFDWFLCDPKTGTFRFSSGKGATCSTRCLCLVVAHHRRFGDAWGALEFIFSRVHKVSVKHHVDDFLFVVAVERTASPLLFTMGHVEVPVAGSTERKKVSIPASVPDVAVQAFVEVLTVGADLGVPWSWDKTITPTQSLAHLGIGIDTKSMIVFVPEARLAHTTEVIRAFLRNANDSANQSKEDRRLAQASGNKRRCCTRRQLQSLIGKLAFVCRVFPPGRCFLNRLLTTLRTSRGRRGIPVLPWLAADLEWWLWALPVWKGSSAIPRARFAAFAEEVFGTDACNDGYGGHWRGQYFSEEWTVQHRRAAQRVTRHSMPWMELYAVAAAVALWSENWSGKRVLVKVDCEPVKYWINKGNTTNQETIDLLRSIADHCVKFNFELMAEWVAGQTNVLADALSRLNVSAFLQLSSNSTSSGRVRPPGFTTVISAHGRLC